MFSIRSIAMKLFRAAWAHVATSISIIAISICLILSMSLYIWNANTQMREEIKAVFGETDLTVGYNPDQEKTISSELLSQINSVIGIDMISPVSITHTQVDTMEHVYTIGVENDELVKSRYHFSKDLKTNEVILSEGIAKVLKKNIGDEILVENKSFLIKEILTTIKMAEETSFILMQNAVVKQWVPYGSSDTEGLFVLIKADYPKAVGQELKQLDNTFRIDIMNEYDFVKLNLQSLMIYIIVLSVFIVVITGMLLLSTFQLFFYKLKEQFMILRSLGASSNQIGRIINTQLTSIITLGVVVGTVVSILIIKFGLPQLITFLSLPKAKTDLPAILILSIALIMFTFLQFFTKWQVYKSMQLLPLQIESNNEDNQLKWTTGKKIVSSVMSFISILCLVTGQLPENSGDKGPILIIIGSLTLCGVVLLLIPFILKALLSISLQPMRSLFGKEVYLACQQLLPQVKRNSAVVLSLVGLMVILIFGSSLLKSVQSNEQKYIHKRYETSIILSNQIEDDSITPSVVEEIENLPSIAFAYGKSNFSVLEFKQNGRSFASDYGTIDVESYTKLKRLEHMQGDLTKGIIITRQFAESNELSVGETLSVYLPAASIIDPITAGTHRIVAIIPEPLNHVDVYIDWSSVIAKQEKPIIKEIMVETDNKKQAIAELQGFLQQNPTFLLRDKDKMLKDATEMFYQRWSLFVGVFIVLIAATSLGVIQTLLHAIYVKRSDYAVQRLVGLSPNGLIKLILTQVLSFVLYGLTTGTILGLLLTRMLSIIDPEGALMFDYFTLIIVSIFLLLTTLLVFTAQSYWISRSKLALEMKNL
ncbi:FtsX-like permease family protein [Cytobacillus suaedae]|nr:FtsX-like permease family protein [Cytobacillus suaedae]